MTSLTDLFIQVDLATSSTPGIIKKATNENTISGTDDESAVTPATLTAKIDIDSTLEENSDLYIPSQKAVKTYIDLINEDTLNQVFFSSLK